MLIQHVQAAPNGHDSFHIQATGPTFPKGYASGDLSLNVVPRKAFVPSMRGSGRLYFVLTPNEVSANLVGIVAALQAPSPKYSTSDAAAVAKRVQLSLDATVLGEPKPAAKSGVCDIDEATIAKIVKAVVAALKS